MAVKPGLNELMKDHYEQNLKAANYLFVAHGAGLIGCLTLLKDYNPEGHLRGLGTYIVLFGVGFLGSILNYIGLFFARVLVLNAVFEEEDVPAPSRSVVAWLHFIGLGIALIALFIAVVGLIFK